MSENASINLSNVIIENRLARNTKKQYASKALIFQKWLELNHPACVNNGKISLDQISTVIFKEFFGSICLKRKKDGTIITPEKFQSFQHLNGFKSSIKNIFRSENIELKDELVIMMQDFFQTKNC